MNPLLQTWKGNFSWADLYRIEEINSSFILKLTNGASSVPCRDSNLASSEARNGPCKIFRFKKWRCEELRKNIPSHPAAFAMYTYFEFLVHLITCSSLYLYSPLFNTPNTGTVPESITGTNHAILFCPKLMEAFCLVLGTGEEPRRGS